MTYKRRLLLLIAMPILNSVLLGLGVYGPDEPSFVPVILGGAFFWALCSMLWDGYKECFMAWFPGEGSKGWQLKESEREYRKECMWIKGMGLSKHERRAALHQAKIRKLRRAEEIMRQPEDRRAEENWQKW